MKERKMKERKMKERKMKKIKYLVLFFLVMMIISCQVGNEFPVLKGEYLGQTPPGDEPELFAPGIVSNGMNNRDVAMMPDGSEMYFSVSFGNYANSSMLYSRYENGIWTPLEVAPFATNSKYSYYEPFISPDGSKMFFVTEEPVDEDTLRTDSNIWVMDRVDNGWGKAKPLSENINTEYGEYFPSITKKGVLYYTGVDPAKRVNIILRSKWENGKFSDPEILPDHVNMGRSRYNATISPDESYLIIPVFGAEDSYGGTDYYISFRDENDNWSDPVNMGSKINTADNHEWSAYVSPDGKYLFFMSARTDMNEKPEKLTYSYLKEIFPKPKNGNADIYWMSAKIIEEFKP